ncbi:MAG TPA: beta-N-acetylhexosaminidase [Phycisphaerae bacterium]|nr:beta-N-acetylhexosaminidase [Phycisphaerales bacterium]HRX84052.1 beta-N-acetylhexosaminidase [Phycisphaerae bacterium]
MIPLPQQMETGEGSFRLAADTPIACDATAQPVAEYLAELMEAWFGRRPEVATLAANAAPRGLVLTTEHADPKLGEEGYALTIDGNGVRMTAPAAHGLFYAVQTIRQLADGAAADADGTRNNGLQLPCVRIVDQPRFAWRGMHLDVCRHFMPLEFVKKYIDLLAYHKMNVFHWHLTEDQGWRIEIKQYPRLTEFSAWRMEDGKRYGGFYTQDEVREVLAYARQRFVTVVPEIEMPGHALAALAAYPELSCTGGPFEITGKSGVYKDVFCPGNEATFTFLENVLGEVCDLFPSRYIHIGGDECPKTRWEECPKCQARIKAEGLADEHALQSYLVHRIEKFLNARGKRLIGWDEILEGGLAPNATVMSWRGTKGGIAAAREDHDVVMCPSSHCYFDFRQSDREGERGADWGEPIDLAKVYGYEPMPEELTAAEAHHVLGAQANVWTERIDTPADVEYMVFPRACALAEVLWTAPQRKNWADFTGRLATHLRRLAAKNVNYRKPD